MPRWDPIVSEATGGRHRAPARDVSRACCGSGRVGDPPGPRTPNAEIGAPTQGERRKLTREAAEFIASDSEGAPYSVALADGHKHAAHFHYLLRRLGRPPQNEDYFSRRILRQDMGQTIYVIAASALAQTPRLEGLPGPTVALEMDGYRIYRLKAASLPSQVRAVTFVVDPPDWVIRAER